MKSKKIFLATLAIFVGVGLALTLTPKPTITEAESISDRCQIEDREACLTVEVLRFVHDHPEQTKTLFEGFGALLEDGTLTDDPRLFSPLIHEVGMELAFNKIPPEMAFDYCPLNFKAGCLHGVVMQYLDEVDTKDPAVFFAFCDFAKEDETFYANCLHGVGHELAAKLTGNLAEILSTCTLPNPSLKHACKTGVLMEFSTGVHGTGHHTHEPEVGSILLPCEEVSELDQATCYLAMSNYRQYSPTMESFETTASVCTSAPEEYHENCILGLAEKIFASNAGNTAASKTVCESFKSLQEACKSSIDQLKDLESFL